MRIAVVVGAFPKLSETFVLDQIAALCDLGHDVRIFAVERSTETLHHEKVQRYGLLERTKVVDTPKRASFRGALRALASRLSRGGEDAFDVVYCHFGHVAEQARRLRHAGVFSGPLVAVFHAYDLTVVPRLRGRNFYAPLFAEAARLLPITELWQRELVALGADPSRIEVRRMGVDLDAFSFRERRLSAGETLQLVSVGRLVEKKGFRVALEALARVRSELPAGAEYHLVGDGPLRPELERLVAERDLSNLVTFHGSKSHADVAALLESMHVFVAPSVTAKDGDMEGLPVVLLEAMARGLPVVATRHSGIPELVRDGESGRLVPENDAKALGEALLELAREPARWASYGRAGRSTVEASHDAKRLARELSELFETLSASSRAPGAR